MNILERDERLRGRRHIGVTSLRPRAVPRWYEFAKRATDITGSIAILTLCAPIVLGAAIAISIVSHGSPVFAQERVGIDGRRFRMYKLRSMVEGAHLLHDDVRHLNDVTGPVLKIKRDPRLHALGSFLRRTSIDELPNFINVLRGEMSIVGPRPPLPSEVEHYDASALRRLTVKPGITCLWQINGRSHIDFEHWMELDCQYIQSWTPLGDLAIILKTVPAVIRGTGAH